MAPPRSASRYSLKGATPAVWQSQSRGVLGSDISHRLTDRLQPPAASCDALKGATPAVWQSQSRGVLGSDISRRPKNCWGPPSRQRGFTLIELLVAITIMSMLALLSWRSLDGMTRTQTLTQQRADELLRLQAALGQWGADLDAIVETGEVNALEFNGQVLRMTRRDSAEAGLQSPGVRVVAWARHTGVQRSGPGAPNPATPSSAGSSHWMRWQSPPLVRRDELARAWQRAADWGSGAQAAAADSAGGGNDSAIALLGIDQWELFYHRGETWANPLSSVGTESTGVEVAGVPPATVLPNGVRLVLTLSSGQGLSGPLVRDWVRPTLQAGRP
ncbi:type II secretion system protein J [Hydrogenophaga sp.]|uniref:PulJ/GspJ family protein n=1 Tax=Hydrogenophaga sp. TaxID=1904254 RepID=UPI00273204E9|nr:prepilin-type N-terminal cleavage/methylation domain-containing protein [Hydrogenophaga sp.]